MLEDRAKDFAGTEEHIELILLLFAQLSIFSSLLFVLRLSALHKDSLPLVKILEHFREVKFILCHCEMLHEEFIRYTQTVEQQNHLPIQIALGEGCTSDDLKFVFVALELELTVPDLYHLAF